MGTCPRTGQPVMSSRSSATTSSPTWRTTSQTGTPGAVPVTSAPPDTAPRSREVMLSAAIAERRSSPVMSRTRAPGGGGAPRGRSTRTTSCSARIASRTASAQGRGPPRTSPVRTGMACHTGRAPTRWPGRKADSSAGRSAQRSPVRTLSPHRRSRPPTGSRSIIATRLPARPSAHARCSSRTLAPRPPRAPVTARIWAACSERITPSSACASPPGGPGLPAEGLRGEKATSWPSHAAVHPVSGPTRAACAAPAAAAFSP